jgi:2-oxoglutarate dehydrogenase E2 component (dihydrolipoamide succinyltransferase)
LEIATDKVDSEVPAQKGGILVKRLFNEGDVVQVGTVIAIIADSASSSLAAPVAAAAKIETPPVIAAQQISQPIVSTGDRFYSPLVKSIAKEEQISNAELDAISGTGKEGRLTKEDLLNYIAKRKSSPASVVSEHAPAPVAQTVVSSPATSAPATSTPIKSTVSVNAGDEIIEMDRMRKLIADHMVKSKHTSPHVTSFVEADVTNIVMWRDKIKNAFEKRESEKITFTPIFIEAIARAIKDFPMINIAVDGNNIIKRKDINIGMAAALPSGNLIVPVIKNADQKNLIGLTKAVNDLANRARAGKLTPDEISGGTFTLTNVGSFGNVMGTPIINQPQVAIMAVGAIKKKPVVIETPQGDTIGIRHMMFLSHSYDHRVVDGSLGGSFVRRVADYLEAFDLNRII